MMASAERNSGGRCSGGSEPARAARGGEAGISFGGLKAVQQFSLRLPAQGPARPHRSERGGQDDCVQFAHRRVSA